MIENIKVRFFCMGWDTDGEWEMFEVTEECFKRVAATDLIEYERHTMRENGVSQICLCTGEDSSLDRSELEVICLAGGSTLYP